MLVQVETLALGVRTFPSKLTTSHNIHGIKIDNIRIGVDAYLNSVFANF
jgi:hypothetical protein